MDYFFIKSTSYILAQEEHFGKRDFRRFPQFRRQVQTFCCKEHFRSVPTQKKKHPEGCFFPHVPTMQYRKE